MEQLSPEQAIAFGKYINKENIFITGPGGAGKTALIRTIYRHSIMNKKRIQVCALTGCAAILLQTKAKTIHSFAGIGLGTGDPSVIVQKILNNHFRRKSWRQTEILVIDEVSMMSKKLFELLDMVARAVRRNNRPFGGIQLIFSGDFYQLPPVGDKNDADSGAFCFESEQWFNTFAPESHIQLIKIFRQSDEKYASILNQIREGRIKRSSIQLLEQHVNRELPEDSLIRPTKLFPTRNRVEQININEMNKLQTDAKEYKMVKIYNLPVPDKNERPRKKAGLNVIKRDSSNPFESYANKEQSVEPNSKQITEEAACDDDNTEPQEKQHFTREEIEAELQYLQSGLLCDDTLRLKVGAQVMCIVNIELPDGNQLCNGSQGIVTGISPGTGSPIVRFNIGNRFVESIMGYHVWASEKIPTIGISMVPLILAWALTIHKSQGSTLECAEIDVGSSVFECGQTYVALSRVKSLDGLYLTSFDVQRIKINKKVNEFYKRLNEQSLHP